MRPSATSVALLTYGIKAVNFTLAQWYKVKAPSEEQTQLVIIIYLVCSRRLEIGQ